MENRMNRFLKILPLLFLPLLFTSCFDYVQSISASEDDYNLYYRVALSRVMFAVSGEDPNSFLDDITTEPLEKLPETVVSNKIDTEYEVGAEHIVTIPKNQSKGTDDIVPHSSGNKTYIPFLLGAQTENLEKIRDMLDDSEEGSSIFLNAMVSTIKCKVFVSKEIVPKITTAYFEGKGRSTYQIPFYDMGIMYCIEVPFITILEENKYKFEQIVVTK